jgi:M6 family metalloprotease-like protein
MPSTSRGTTDAAWNQLFFDATPGVKSVRNFYREASFSQLDLQPAAETYGTANDGVVAVTLNYAHPNPPTAEDNRLITSNALVAANAFVDYSSFDTNGNGALDGTELHLVIVARGFEESYGGTGGSCTPNVWGHRGALYFGLNPDPPTLDGVIVAADDYHHGYTQVGEWHEFSSDGCDGGYPGHMATMGIMAHELGHDIDWPDLYDTNSADGSSSAGVGYWSIMSGGSWGRSSGSEFIGTTPTLPDAFLKWYQHWITPTQVTAPMTSVALPNSAQNPVAYLLGTNPGGIDWDFKNTSGTGEYFLVENRQQQGFDTGLWRIDSVGNAHGCLIWHIDETRTSANTANANPLRKLVDVEEAEDTQDLDTNANSGDLQDVWPGTTARTTFNDTSTPNSHWYDGSISGIAVTNISTVGTGCTVDFSGVGPTWDGSTSSDWNTTDNWSVGRVPTQTDNTVIPSGVPNWPNINVAASAGNVNILNGAHLNATADATLDVYGNWAEAGTGYFDASAGTVALRGIYAQSMTAGANSHFNHLQIGSGSTALIVTAGSDLDVNGNLTIQSGAQLAAGSHTLRVGGNWTDNPFGFNPGSGTVILDGAAQTIQRAASELVVYSNDLSSTTGWTTYDANGGGYWAYSTSTAAPNSPDHGLHARYFYSTTVAADDWLFSPGFTLQAGVTYAIRFNYGAYGASWPEKLRANIGTAQTAAAMTTQVFDNNNVINTVWQQGSGTFTPGTTGTYYVGFYCYSDANRAYPAVDDLVVTALDPNLAFYNLSVSGSGVATLADNVAVQNNLAVNAGVTLTLGTNNATVEGTVTNNGRLAQTKTISGTGAAFLNIKNAAASVDKYWGAIITSTGNMSATTVVIGGNQNCTTRPADPLITRCFNISPTTSQNATIRFYYTNAELNGQTISTLAPWHWSLPIWDPAGNTYSRSTCTTGQQDCWLEAQNVTAYSPFGLGGGIAPTAVRLKDLAANPMGSISAIGLPAPLALLSLSVLGLLWWGRRRKVRGA